MKLTPYPDLKMRWEKVLKHVFQRGEAWWEVFGDKAAWHADRDTLRRLGILHTSNHRLSGDVTGAAREILDRNHAAWLAAAQRACEQALAKNRVVWDDKSRKATYVGDLAVLVVATRGGNLVTCFRPSMHNNSGIGPRLDRALHKMERAAVRRQERRASVDRALPKAPPTERDDA